MYSTNAPIATSFSLSVLLHGAVVAALLLVYQQAATTGQGLAIELVSSTMISDQQETDRPRNNNREMDAAEKMVDKSLKTRQPRPASQDVLVSANRAFDFSTRDPVAKDLPVEQRSYAEKNSKQQKIADEGNSSVSERRSTNAAQQHLAILSLLHDSISSNKEYPYIARRQRREGVATVGFVLHPDGSIEDPHLVTSSSAGVLDRAALTAVKRIEPFKPAQEYLDHAETFKIDVVFNLL